MKILKRLLIVVIAIVLIAAGYLAYLGAFKSIEITEKDMGPYTIAYERYVGPYQNTGKVFEKVYQSLAKEGVAAARGIGIYYDDPKTTAPEKLRSDCGSLIEGASLTKIKSIKKKYKTMVIPKTRCILAEFPLKNNLSYMIGPMKAYPALMEYAKSKKLKAAIVFELYDMPAKTIYYLMGIKK